MTYPKSLHGKVALVIGGSGAIGAATSRMLADAGATVAITHLPREQSALAASGIVQGLPGSGHSAHAADVADRVRRCRKGVTAEVLPQFGHWLGKTFEKAEKGSSIAGRC